MNPRIGVTIDTNDPEPLMAFWCEVLGYVVEGPPGGYPTWFDYWNQGLGIAAEDLGDDANGTSIVDPDGVRPRIWFQPVPEPKVGKNRVHLDVVVGGDRLTVPIAERRQRVDDAVARLTPLGATVLRTTSDANYYAVVMRDPQGNEFCLT